MQIRSDFWGIDFEKFEMHAVSNFRKEYEILSHLILIHILLFTVQFRIFLKYLQIRTIITFSEENSSGEKLFSTKKYGI